MLESIARDDIQSEPKKAKKSTDVPRALPSRRTATLPPRFKPKTAARHHRSKYLRRRMVADYLRKVFRDVKPIQVDFDLAVAFFLQETSHLKLGRITKAVQKILKEFSLLGPCTGRQENLYFCAKEIRDDLDAYKANPSGPKPFALRVPTLKALHRLGKAREANPTLVGRDEAVILVDLKERTLAVGVPPKVAPTTSLEGEVENRDRLGGEVRACMEDFIVQPLTY